MKMGFILRGVSCQLARNLTLFQKGQFPSEKWTLDQCGLGPSRLFVPSAFWTGKLVLQR